MKKSLCLLLIVSQAGCATFLPYTGQEICAGDGMKLSGLSRGSSRGMAVGNNGAVAVSGGSSFGVYCEPPKTQEEKEEVARAQASAAPKIEYNEHLEMKRFANGVGYILWVVPGVLMKVIFDHQRDEAEKKSDELSRAPASISSAK